MKRKTIKAKRIEDALKACLPGLLPRESGAIYGFELDTKLGKLYLSPCDGAIRTRFEDVPVAAPCGTSLNPYSGKWNFEGLDDDSEVGRAIYWIERISA
jgi:hypothetical protein